MSQPRSIVGSRLFQLLKLYNKLRYGDLNQRCFEAAQNGDTHAVQVWITRGANPSFNNNAAIKVARENGHQNTVEWLTYLGCGD